jgi:glycosyltransferase involved in cell wall biosynthesis
MPAVSVITVVKDHLSGLKDTYASLLEQDFTDWQMIIIVGQSKDGTLIMARELALKDSRVKVEEQVTIGIYGAMNEGIGLANSEFSWFMNAGDKFATPSSMNQGLAQIIGGSLGVVVGGYQLEIENIVKTYQFSSRKLTPLNFAFNRRGGCHQAMIFRTKKLVELGGYDTSYTLASDFDLVLKVIMNSGGKRVPDVLAKIEPGGRSDQGIHLVHKEKHAIRNNLLGGSNVLIGSFVWTFLVRVKMTLRRLLNK